MIVRKLATVVAAFVWACAAFFPPPVAADVISPSPEGCSQSEEIGDVQLDTDLIPPRDDNCYDKPANRLRVLAIGATWEPASLPISVTVKRDRSGYRLFMTSLISDRHGRLVCWSEGPIGGYEANSSRQFWNRMARAFDRWAASCPAMQTIGLDAVQESFLARRSDFSRALTQLARVPHRRFGPPEESVGIGSFLPSRISQNLLDAIADACAGSRNRLRIQPDGTIQFDYDSRVPYGADGSLPFDSCVQQQIRYFPGYRAPI